MPRLRDLILRMGWSVTPLETGVRAHLARDSWDPEKAARSFEVELRDLAPVAPELLGPPLERIP